MANANDLQKRIQIWKYDRSVNQAGTPIEGFKFYKYTYASLKLLSGNLNNDPAPGTVAETLIDIIIRHDPQIDYNCKIVYKCNSYRIQYIEEITEKAFLKLRCYVYNENHPSDND